MAKSRAQQSSSDPVSSHYKRLILVDGGCSKDLRYVQVDKSIGVGFVLFVYFSGEW